MIAYIESPLQLLCAIEFHQSHKSVKTFFIRKSTNATDKQIEYILNKYSFLKINYSFISNLELINIFSWILFIGKNFYKKVLFGNDDSVISYFFIRKTLSDDGTKTISIVEKNKSKKYWTFFNLYNLKTHSFEFFKDNFKTYDLATENSIYLIGQKLVEEKLLDKHTYMLILKKIKSKYSNHSIYYFKHRGENDVNLNEIKKIGFIIKSLDYPIEFHPIEQKIMPSHIISFCSTALISLYEIYGLNFSYFTVNELIKKSNSKYNYVKIYEYLSIEGEQLTL